ncbi:MAG: nucleoside triphosphate pyrophosphohydrolase, partial [Planctomycetes bacterium]|nr:nucleoside triphosphate pyrophosphohydrolase [Planctomycetota bacterium]
MRRLRDEGGCPWDKEQTHQSLKPYLVEETYEVIDAIDENDPEALKEELGDLLFQIFFHSQIASEKGEFDIGGVMKACLDKMTSRHPHVFG